MKIATRLALLATLGMTCASSAAAQAEPYLWADEFNGFALDPKNWGFQIGNGETSQNPGWGNRELEYYTNRPENVGVKDGNLVITARKESFKGDLASGGSDKIYGWTSARIRTSGKFSRAYGKIEVRAKLPLGQGIWPAVWLLPDLEGNPYGTWASSGEIDLIETRGDQAGKVWQTLHYGGQWPNNVNSGFVFNFPSAGTIADWHIYTLEWRAGEIRWLIDGVVTSTKTAWWSSKANPPSKDADLNPWPAPFDQPFYALINLAVGGNFGGDPDSSTPSTSQMLVDYIRWSALPDETRSPGPRPTLVYPWTTGPERPALTDGNLVLNPGFDWTANNDLVGANPTASNLPNVSNSSYWTVYQTGTGEAFTLANDPTAGNSLKLDISKPGSVNYAVQIRQDGLSIKQKKRYQVDFDAWSSVARSVMSKVGGGETRGYSAYSGEQKIDLTTTPNAHHSYTFSMSGTTDNSARMEFNFGAAGVGQIWLDNVVVKEIGEVAETAPRPTLAGGNLIYNGAFTLNPPDVSGIVGVPQTAYWTTWENGNNGLKTTLEGNELHLSVLRVDPANNWHIQLNQPNIPLEAGKSYTLSFKARADSARAVGVVVGENGGSYARYLDKSAGLSTMPQTFTYTFTANTTNMASQLQILGAVGNAGEAYNLYFSDFKLLQN